MLYMDYIQMYLLKPLHSDSIGLLDTQYYPVDLS